MGDFALQWADGSADMFLADDDLASEEGLETCVLLSAFTDRRAESDDELPGDDGDRRGWWGDEFLEQDNDRFGSRLWLLERAKLGPSLIPRAESYLRECLQWMLDDRVTDRIDAVSTIVGGQLYHHVTLHRPGFDPVSFKFAHVWAGEARRALVESSIEAPVIDWSALIMESGDTLITESGDTLVTE